MDIFTPIQINGVTIKNRLVLPPIVNFGWGDKEGFANNKHVVHYKRIAKGGAGLIVVEATCVQPNGRIFSYQLGLWDDSHIDNLAEIAQAIKSQGAVALIQIHHAGLLTHKRLCEFAHGPSIDNEKDNSAEMSEEQIIQLRNDFIQAAQRAYRAGFDGVELHGAHGYLLNQFATSAINHRTDSYGGSHENMLRLAKEIVDGIKSTTPESFIIGYRTAGCSPTLDDGIAIAKLLEQYGVHYLHVSHGGTTGINPELPAGLAFNQIVYMGTQIKKHVNIPVIAVNQIKTPERANLLVSQGLVDMVAIGRDMLTDPDWAAKAQNNEAINLCVDCQPRCKRFTKPESCPLFDESIYS